MDDLAAGRGLAVPTHASVWQPPTRVVVVDADVLARCCCEEARGRVSLVSKLPATRCLLYVAAHVPAEVDRCLPRVAAKRRPPVPLADALDAWARIRRLLRVVELPVGEYLRPEIADIRRRWPAGSDRESRQLTGDPDDLGTAALAALLASSVVISGDSVFARQGMVAAVSWHSTARGLIVAGQIEGSWHAGATVTLAAGSAGVEGVKALVRQVRVRPWVVVAAAGGALLVWLLLPERARRAIREGVAVTLRVAKTAAEKVGASVEVHQRALDGVRMVEDPPWRQPTLVELCARHLARTGTALTAAELRDHLRAALADPGFTSAAAIDRELRRHPAFHAEAGARWRLGRAVQAA